MTKLGDFFSENIKGKLAGSNIVPGNVIRCFTTDTNPPKEKRFVVLGVDVTGALIGTVFINSDVNFNVINSQELLELQYPIKKAGNEYLAWDSFVDCSKLVRFEYEYVKSKIVEKPKCVLGTVKSDDLKIIYELVQKSPVISKAELKKFGLN